MNINNLYGIWDDSNLDALRRLQKQINNSALVVSLRELQRTVDAVKVPTPGVIAAVQTYQDLVAPLLASAQGIEKLYAPILEQTRNYEQFYNSSLVAAMKSSVAAMDVITSLDLPSIQGIIDAIPKYPVLSDSILDGIDLDAIAGLYEDGEITDNDIADELQTLVQQKNFSLVETWDNIKKAKWFLAIRWILVIVMFFSGPVIDAAKEDAFEALGVNEFWEDTGIYEWLDDLFGVGENEECGNTETEEIPQETAVEDTGTASEEAERPAVPTHKPPASEPDKQPTLMEQ